MDEVKTFIRIVIRDGSFFELPATSTVDVGQFIATAKAVGYIAHKNWYVPYDSVLWAGRVDYRPTAEGQTVLGTLQ